MFLNLKNFKTVVINYDLIRTLSFSHFFSIVLDCYFHFILSIILNITYSLFQFFFIRVFVMIIYMHLN